MGVFLAPGPVNRVQVKTGGDPPQQAPEGAVFPGGQGWSLGQWASG